MRTPGGAQVEAFSELRYSFTNAEGSHNGSAAVLKTAGRKAMQVRVLSPPPPFQSFRTKQTPHIEWVKPLHRRLRLGDLKRFDPPGH